MRRKNIIHIGKYTGRQARPSLFDGRHNGECRRK